MLRVITMTAYRAWFAPQPHDHLAADFDHYLESFQRDSSAAHRSLVAKYDGKPVALNEVASQLGYRPAIADGLPTGYRVVSTHVMSMPCCRCVSCLCQREDGSVLAIFEHDEEQPVWFGERPSVSARCGKTQCNLIQMGNGITASWQREQRQMTVVGVRDLAEIQQLVTWFNRRKGPSP